MSGLPDDDVFDAIQQYLGYTDDNGAWVPGVWDTADAALFYENELDGPPDGGRPWVQVILDTALYGQQTIGGGVEPGGNRWDEDGTLWFHIFTAKGRGSREARRIGKGLANLFRGHTLLDEDLEFRDADMGAGDPGAENANFYLLSVSIDWRRTNAN